MFKGNDKIGHLRQESQLDPTKTIIVVVKDVVTPLVDKLLVSSNLIEPELN